MLANAGSALVELTHFPRSGTVGILSSWFVALQIMTAPAVQQSLSWVPVIWRYVGISKRLRERRDPESASEQIDLNRLQILEDIED